MPTPARFVLLQALATTTVAQTFGVRDNKFVINGTFPVTLASGEMHYSRVHPKLWSDRLGRARAMGLNAIATYVPWNWHEATPGKFDFTSEWRDLAAFVRQAGEHGLFVLLRGGPYMCGEWEFGGFPAWMLYNGTLTLRTYAQPYMSFVERYWAALLPVVRPLMFHNGGNVLMFQVENEFGSYGDVSQHPSDKQYMEALVSLARAALGNEALLYTTDGGDAGYMTRGSLPGGSVMTVGDGCGNPEATWEAQKKFNPPGGSPFMCAELYPGWLTHWGEQMANTSSASAANLLGKVLDTADGWGSANLYMAHGGTSFAWTAGANGGGGASYQPDITSYDYDAPISEGGEHGYGSDRIDKFEAVRQQLIQPARLARMLWYGQPASTPPAPPPPEAPLAPRAALGAVPLDEFVPFLDAAYSLQPSLASTGDATPPAGVERVGCFGGGFAVFEASLAEDVAGGARLSLPLLHDRALVFIDTPVTTKEYVGTIYRTDASAVLRLPSISKGSRITILLELLARINFSHGMDDGRFGLLGGVLVEGKPLAVTSDGWSTRCVDVEDAARRTQFGNLSWAPRGTNVQGPAFFRATFTSVHQVDTFLHLPGFVKGVVWVNGFGLGRYWNTQGPQQTLYVPWPLIRANAANELVVLELHNASANATVEFLDRPQWGVPPTPPPPCDGPAAGDVLQMLSCGIHGSPLAAHQAWTFDAIGRLSLDGRLCVSVGPGTDPTYGFPLAQLEACSSTDSRQRLAPERNSTTADPQPIVHTGRDYCLDVSNHDMAEGAPVGFYACVAGSGNQQWSRSPPLSSPLVGGGRSSLRAEEGATDGAPTRLVVKESGKCLSAC